MWVSDSVHIASAAWNPKGNSLDILYALEIDKQTSQLYSSDTQLAWEVPIS